MRIKDLVRQLMPMTPLTGELGMADLAVLERWADPRALLAAGVARLTALIAKASHGHQGADRAEQWRAAAAAAVELYADHPAVRSRPGRRGRHRGAAAAGHPGRARRPRRRTRSRLPVGRSRPAGAVPARVGRDRRPGPGRRDGRPGRFRDGTAVQVLHRPGAPRLRDRGHRPQGPADDQGRVLAAAHHPGPGRRHRPQARPPARPDLLPADDRTRRRPTSRPAAWSPATSPNGPGPSCNRGMPYVICDTNGSPVTPAEAKTDHRRTLDRAPTRSASAAAAAR